MSSTPFRVPTHLRSATQADVPRIYEMRHGTAENRLNNPALVTDAEIAWYIGVGTSLVSEDAAGVQGFTCMNDQTAYVSALFVIDCAQGCGHGTRLLDAGLSRLREAGHRQAFLSTGAGTKAAAFYRSRGWQDMGTSLQGEMVLRRWL